MTTSKKPVIYIIGPYRADIEREVVENIREAEKCAIEVWKAGGIALCPHMNTALFGGICPDEVWLEGDLELMRRCDAVYISMNAIVTCSKRSLAEVTEADRLGLQRLYNEEEVKIFCYGWRWNYRNEFGDPGKVT